jgi:amidase
MRDLVTLSAVEAAKQARAGTIRAADLVEAALERIEALNGRLQAFMTIDEAGARRTAERLDALPAAQRGPLHGLPIAFKDLVATAGVRTTYGSLLYADNKPAANELFVSRTLEAGGVMIGKTTTPEFGFGAICQNQLAGPTANPYDLSRTSGGSSGGSAVAVCTGMAAIAHGTDFGGSGMAPTATMSLFGLPALSIPCGWTNSGLPVGLQIVGRPFEEDTMLSFAYTLQENLGFAHHWPSLS